MTGWHLIEEDLGTAIDGHTLAHDWIGNLCLEAEALAYLEKHEAFARFLRERGDEAPI